MNNFPETSAWWRRAVTGMLMVAVTAVPAYAEDDAGADAKEDKKVEEKTDDAPKEEEAPTTVQWIKDLDEGFKLAKEQGKNVFLYFGRERPG